MSMTIGAAIMAGVKGIVGIISSLTIPQALAVGAFVGGVAYTLYVKIKSSKKMSKKAKEASTVSQKVTEDYENRRRSRKNDIDFDRLDRDMDEIRTRDERETDRIYKDILDEIDADNQVRNRGKKHRYTRKNAKKDFAAIKKMKDRAKKKRRGGYFERNLEEEIAKFYNDVEAISRAEEDKSFSRYVGEEDDFSRASDDIFEQDFAKILKDM